MLFYKTYDPQTFQGNFKGSLADEFLGEFHGVSFGLRGDFLGSLALFWGDFPGKSQRGYFKLKNPATFRNFLKASQSMLGTPSQENIR